jgi:hypothetical protein
MVDLSGYEAHTTSISDPKGQTTMQNGRIYRKGSAWILSYAVKAQEPDGKITWAGRSKRLAPYGDDYTSGRL